MGKWLDRQTADPTPWLMDKACPAIRLRLLTEIGDRPLDDPDVVLLREEAYNYKPAYTIATTQDDDGTWFNSLIGFENLNINRRRGPGTASQFRALVEYGWGRDHPILWRSSELLQGLLWEDPSIELRELKGYCAGDPAVETHLRHHLSRVALALLLRSGLVDDVGIERKTAERLGELESFYTGGEHERIYVGEHLRQRDTDDGPVDEVCAVISPDAPLPDQWLLLFFAHNPKLRADARARAILGRVIDYMFSHPHPEHEVLVVGGKIFEREQEFSIRNLGRADYERERLLGRLLQELELLARAGVLESIPKAVELLEWVISLQDEEGVVRGEDFIEKHNARLDYPYFPLEDNWRGKHKKFTDLTFRLFLILAILDGIV
ncbi:MAG: hypothetical protein H6807_13395 [Planctomycetes bacterium]|nr:hypothetical protein [Planctomycetota bacterium]